MLTEDGQSAVREWNDGRAPDGYMRPKVRCGFERRAFVQKPQLPVPPRAGPKA